MAEGVSAVVSVALGSSSGDGPTFLIFSAICITSFHANQFAFATFYAIVLDVEAHFFESANCIICTRTDIAQCSRCVNVILITKLL
jgi:hypothetical protein